MGVFAYVGWWSYMMLGRSGMISILGSAFGIAPPTCTLLHPPQIFFCKQPCL